MKKIFSLLGICFSTSSLIAQWNIGETNIYNSTSGNMGSAIMTPQVKLDVLGSALFWEAYLTANSASHDIQNDPDSCLGTITYNTGVVPGGVTKAGYINAGSTAGTGGSGTVTIHQDQTTSLIAAQEINLKPEFQASVTSGTFTASINPCTTDSVEHNIQAFSTEKSMHSNVIVYPSPGNGILNISGDINDLDNALIIVTDQLGRQVYETQNNSKNTAITLNLGHLDNGIYYVQIKSLIKIITKKIVIKK